METFQLSSADCCSSRRRTEEEAERRWRRAAEAARDRGELAAARDGSRRWRPAGGAPARIAMNPAGTKYSDRPDLALWPRASKTLEMKYVAAVEDRGSQGAGD